MTDSVIRAIKDGTMSPTEAVKVVNEMTPVELRLGRQYKPKGKEARATQYAKKKALRREMLINRVPFIHRDFLPDFFLCQGLILVAAMSGNSKSTTAANVLACFAKECPSGKAVVITNEESADAVYDRVSCILTKTSYIDLYKGKLSPQDEDMIEDTSHHLMDAIEVVDDDSWDMSCLEDVQSVLEYAAKDGVNLVILDYLQTVTWSRKDPNKESFQISKDLGLYLKDYGKRVGVPIVTFAQLKPKTESGELHNRIQNDKTIYNHAFTVIEVVPDFQTLMTTFTIHKDRFGYVQGKEVVLKFNHGRYELTEDVL